MSSAARKESNRSGSKDNGYTNDLTNGSLVTGCRLIVGAGGAWRKLMHETRKSA